MRHDFTEVEIRHRMSSLCMLYSVTLTFIFKVKHSLGMYLLKKVQAADVVNRFASTRTAPYHRGVALVLLRLATGSPPLLGDPRESSSVGQSLSASVQ